MLSICVQTAVVSLVLVRFYLYMEMDAEHLCTNSRGIANEPGERQTVGIRRATRRQRKG
jgi:hypothetical protein